MKLALARKVAAGVVDIIVQDRDIARLSYQKMMYSA